MAGIRCGLADVEAATSSSALSPRIRGKLELLRQHIRSQVAALERSAAHDHARRAVRTRRHLERTLRRIENAVDAAAMHGRLPEDARATARRGLLLCLDRLAAL